MVLIGSLPAVLQRNRSAGERNRADRRSRVGQPGLGERRAGCAMNSRAPRRSQGYVASPSAGSPAPRGDVIGQPVVHFEVIGKDADKLKSYYSELFGWEMDSSNAMNYGVVQRDGNTNSDGAGIGGGISAGPEGYEGHVTFYVEVPDVEAALAQAESLGGARVFSRGLLRAPASARFGTGRSSGSSPTAPRAAVKRLDRRPAAPARRLVSDDPGRGLPSSGV